MSAEPVGQRFLVLPGLYAVCRLASGSALPAWAAGEFVSITATGDELSVFCPAEHVPAEVQAARDWRVLKLVGPFPFTTVGVLASVAGPLATAGLSLLTVGTYDTDYLLVKAGSLDEAVAVLTAAGHARVA